MRPKEGHYLFKEKVRKYLLTLVFRLDSNRDEVMGEIKTILTEHGGKIEKEEDLPTKKLAYEIKKERDGNFALLHIIGKPTLVAALTETLRINESLLRYLIVTDTTKLEEVK